MPIILGFSYNFKLESYFYTDQASSQHIQICRPNQKSTENRAILNSNIFHRHASPVVLDHFFARAKNLVTCQVLVSHEFIEVARGKCKSKLPPSSEGKRIKCYHRRTSRQSKQSYFKLLIKNMSENDKFLVDEPRKRYDNFSRTRNSSV